MSRMSVLNGIIHAGSSGIVRMCCEMGSCTDWQRNSLLSQRPGEPSSNAHELCRLRLRLLTDQCWHDVALGILGDATPGIMRASTISLA